MKNAGRADKNGVPCSMRIRANFLLLTTLLIVMACVCAALCLLALTGNAAAGHGSLRRGELGLAILAAVCCALLARFLFTLHASAHRDGESRLFEISRILSEPS